MSLSETIPTTCRPPLMKEEIKGPADKRTKHSSDNVIVNDTALRTLGQDQASASFTQKIDASPSKKLVLPKIVSESPLLKPSTQIHHDPRERVIYQVANGRALLNCIPGTAGAPPTGVLTLKLKDGRYVKFRNLTLSASVTPSEQSTCIPIGNPALLYISPSDYVRQYIQHINNPQKYGDSKIIVEAASDFLETSEKPALRIRTAGETEPGKLTTERDAMGTVRTTIKLPRNHGTSKGIYESKQDSATVARAKIFFPVYKLNVVFLKKIELEIEYSQILRTLKVPHILPLSFVQGEDIRKKRIEMPLAQGDLENVLLQKPTISQEERLKFAEQILETASQLHEIGVVHNDLSLANCLVIEEKNATTGEQERNIYFGDLGSLSKKGETTTSGTHPSPQQTLSSPGKTPQTYPADPTKDCWALGILLFQVIYGRLPRYHAARLLWSAGVTSITQGGATLRQCLDTRDPFAKIIEGLLQENTIIDPSKGVHQLVRLTAKEALTQIRALRAKP